MGSIGVLQKTIPFFYHSSLLVTVEQLLVVVYLYIKQYMQLDDRIPLPIYSNIKKLVWYALLCNRSYTIINRSGTDAGVIRANQAMAADWCMMTASNGNIFRVTGPLFGEFTGHLWIPLTKASEAELWCFLRSAPKQSWGWWSDLRAHYDVIVMINGWVNNRVAGDLSRHRAHYDVIVIYWVRFVSPAD